jgi:hypothetical protein
MHAAHHFLISFLHTQAMLSFFKKILVKTFGCSKRMRFLLFTPPSRPATLNLADRSIIPRFFSPPPAFYL